MNEIPLEPYVQLTEAEIHLALREIQFGGACTLWVNATETVSGLLPSDWRDFEAEKFQTTVRDIWDDVKKEVARIGDCNRRDITREKKSRDHVIVSSGWWSYQAGRVEGGGSGTRDELGALHSALREQAPSAKDGGNLSLQPAHCSC